MKKIISSKHHLSKYHANVPVDALLYAKSGMTDNQIAEALGVTFPTFTDWRKKQPALEYALSRARDGKKGMGNPSTFKEYVYKQLPADLQELWDQIDMWFDAKNGMEKVEAMLANTSKQVRQSLWMHAMVHTNFNASEACRIVCIDYTTLGQWKQDPEFNKLLEQIEWHKDNFLEGSLFRLVEEGNTLATVFANKTKNRYRGYGEKISVQHTGMINHTHHHVVSIDKLNLPLETRIAIRDRMRELKQVEQEPEDYDTTPPRNALAALMDEEDDEEYGKED